MPLKLLIIAGARPNFMKVAPLIKAVNAHNARNVTKLDWKLVHTGQHYDKRMSEVFFKELGIPEPDINLEVGSGSHAVQTACIMTRFEPLCLKQRPAWVIVVGDVNSSMACTLVASKLGIRVAHIEAGLRSFDRSMPEEINRLVTDALADLLLTPSEDANENLRREGIPDAKIRFIGNIMIDTLLANLDKARQSPLLNSLKLKEVPFAYVTLHRPSNVDDKECLRSIMEELVKLSGKLTVVFPMHPRTRKMLSTHGIEVPTCETFKIMEPVGYHGSLCLTEKATLVVTDSGGLQEESTFFQTPCLTLRPNTERPVTITIGSNRLTSAERLARDIQAVLGQTSRKGKIPPLWDGHASERIVAHLAESAIGS